jgi:hypothetical protein
MAKWHYYDENGSKIGPIRGRELKALAQQGTVTPETRVEDENGRVALAKNVMGLPFYEAAQSGSTSSNVVQSEKAPSELSSVMLPPSTVKRFAAPENQAVPQSVAVPIATNSKPSLWIALAAIVVVLMLAAGGAGWMLRDAFSPHAEPVPAMEVDEPAILLDEQVVEVDEHGIPHDEQVEEDAPVAEQLEHGEREREEQEQQRIAAETEREEREREQRIAGAIEAARIFAEWRRQQENTTGQVERAPDVLPPLAGPPFYSHRLGAWLRDVPAFNCGRVASSGKEVLALHPYSPLRSFMATPPAPVMERPFLAQERQPNVIMLKNWNSVLPPLRPVIITEVQTYPDRRWHCFFNISLSDIENLAGILVFRWCAPTPPRPGAPLNRHAGRIGHLPPDFRLPIFPLP